MYVTEYNVWDVSPSLFFSLSLCFPFPSGFRFPSQFTSRFVSLGVSLCPSLSLLPLAFLLCHFFTFSLLLPSRLFVCLSLFFSVFADESSVGTSTHPTPHPVSFYSSCFSR